MAFSELNMTFTVKCRQLHPDPGLGSLKHEHVMTLIFFSLQEGVSPNHPWIKRGDPTVIWPRDWLPGEEEGLGNNILVLSVECYVEQKRQFSVPLQKILVRDLVTNPEWQLDRPGEIVLVGHGLGGLVMKSLKIEVDKISKSHSSEKKSEKKSEKAICEAFQENIDGIVFYSVPHTTSKEEFDNYCNSYTTMRQDFKVQDFEHFNQHMVRLNEDFEQLIGRPIKLFAFVEGEQVMVPQSSTYKLVHNNVCEIEDADHFQVSQPRYQQHASYKRFVQFIQEDMWPQSSSQ